MEITLTNLLINQTMKPRIINKKNQIAYSTTPRLSAILKELNKFNKESQVTVIKKVKIFGEWMKIEENEVEYYTSLSFEVKAFTK